LLKHALSFFAHCAIMGITIKLTVGVAVHLLPGAATTTTRLLILLFHPLALSREH